MGISARPARASPRLARDGERGRALSPTPWGFRQLPAHVRWPPALPRALHHPACLGAHEDSACPPSHPHHRAGISGEGRSLSSTEVTPSRHVRRGGNALLPKRPPGLPRGHGGCTAPAACPGQPPGPKKWHIHLSGSPCCCQPQRARARSPNLWRSPDPKPIGVEVWR